MNGYYGCLKKSEKMKKQKQYKDFLAENKLWMWLDISTNCNAGCPECHRTDIEKGGLGKVDWLPLISWSLEQFKKAYPPEFIKKVAEWDICGTWGDPVMCKDLYQICEYILTNRPDCGLSIDTNGSIRSKTWWKKLGELSKLAPEGHRPIRCDFAIEGINQEMHSMYRRKTHLDKLLANMKSFTDAGGFATAMVVVHKHNQDYLQEIKDLSMNYGAVECWFTESNRFENGPTFEFKDENGDFGVLEQVEGDYYKPDPVRSPQADWKTRIEKQAWFKSAQDAVDAVEDFEDENMY